MGAHPRGTLLSALIDDELAAGEARGVRSHLEACGACRSELERLARAKKWAAAAPRKAMPEDLEAALQRLWGRRSWLEMWLEKWRAWRQALAARLFVSVPGVRAAWATAAAVVVLGLWVAYRTDTEEPLPLEPLLAAHARYGAGGLMPSETAAAFEPISDIGTRYEN